LRQGGKDEVPDMQWSGIVLVNGRGEILLNLRDDKPEINWPNQWDVIGGVVEDGETPDECMVREMMEETGERLREFRAFKVYDVPLLKGEVASFHVFSARLEKAASELVLGEGQEHRFFAVSDLEALEIVRGTDMVLREFIASGAYEDLLR
jgi:8-oxo-dGTP diphosphatase